MTAGRGAHDVDALLFYRSPGDETLHRAVASGYTYNDLHEHGVISGDAFEALENVAEVVERNGRICESEQLMGAWLDAFELAASIHDEDLVHFHGGVYR